MKHAELKAVVNVMWAQPEENGRDFDAAVSYLGLMVTKNVFNIQSIFIGNTRNHPMKPNVTAFMGMI